MDLLRISPTDYSLRARSSMRACRKSQSTNESEVSIMSKVGEGMIRGLKQALAFADGTADKSQYRVHIFPSRASIPRETGRQMPPIHPGEMLREDFLNPLRMTAQMLASEIKVPERRVVAI